MKGDPPLEAWFNAAADDREVARTERDYTWEWPARTAARLVAARFRADPGILGRWGCAPGWCTAWLKEFNTARHTFTYPANATFGQEPWVQFGLVIGIQDQDPETVAEQVIESMRGADPKTRAEMIGGSRDSAEKLQRAHDLRWSLVAAYVPHPCLGESQSAVCVRFRGSVFRGEPAG